MAATIEKSFGKEILKETVCPICFECYKNPRYLPCHHTFCHTCILSHVTNICRQKEAPVGFTCPLCRCFVPAPLLEKIPEKWVDMLPVHMVVEALCLKGENIQLCDPCKRMDEEFTATGWCTECMESLCATCTKSHGRSRASQKHKVVPLSTLNGQFADIGGEHVEQCASHKKKIKYFCQDHSHPCCTHCVCVDHRICKNVDPIDKYANSLVQSEKIDNLLEEIHKYGKAVAMTKSERHDNCKELENSSDVMLQSSDVLRNKIVAHLDELLEKHKNEISKLTKNGRQKQSQILESFLDRQHLAEYYSNTLKKAREGGASVELVVEFHRILKDFSEISHEKLYSASLQLSHTIDDSLLKILNLLKFGKINLEEQAIKFYYDIKLFTIHLIRELDYKEGDITGGCFLPNDEVVFIDFEPDCLLHFTIDGNSLDPFHMKFFPDDVCLNDSKTNTLFVTSSEETEKRCGIYKVKMTETKGKSVEILKLPLQKTCFGVAYADGYVYTACGECVIKMDCGGKVIKQFETEKDTYSVAVDMDNHIVYSSCSSHSVTAVDEDGQKLFHYHHPNLKYPYGLDVDFEGVIFVAGRDSNNIHLLSPSGELIKILPAEKPKCIKFRKDTRVCLIGSENACKTKLCEIK